MHMPQPALTETPYINPGPQQLLSFFPSEILYDLWWETRTHLGYSRPAN